MTDVDVVMAIGQEARLGITTENLYFVAVTTGTEEETAIGRDIELTRMDGRGLITYPCEQP